MTLFLRGRVPQVSKKALSPPASRPINSQISRRGKIYVRHDVDVVSLRRSALAFPCSPPKGDPFFPFLMAPPRGPALTGHRQPPGTFLLSFLVRGSSMKTPRLPLKTSWTKPPLGVSFPGRPYPSALQPPLGPFAIPLWLPCGRTRSPLKSHPRAPFSPKLRGDSFPPLAPFPPYHAKAAIFSFQPLYRRALSLERPPPRLFYSLRKSLTKPSLLICPRSSSPLFNFFSPEPSRVFQCFLERPEYPSPFKRIFFSND